jgi:ribosomal protein S18 acetylase RimI-like enzyme
MASRIQTPGGDPAISSDVCARRAEGRQASVSDPATESHVRALARQRRVFEQFDWWSIEELGAYVRIDRAGVGGVCIAPVAGDAAFAWLRWAAVADGAAPSREWMALLAQSLNEHRAQGVADVWCVLSRGAWLTAYLRDAGFQKWDEIISLERRAPGAASSAGMTLRDAHGCDVAAIAALDAAAFRAPWRYPAPVIARVLAQASLIRVAVRPGASLAQARTEALLGYQCATLQDESAHIIRLAVDPLHAGQHIGSQLLHDAIELLSARGARRITLNTPASFDTLGFYRKHGFRPLTDIADVYRLPL